MPPSTVSPTASVSNLANSAGAQQLTPQATQTRPPRQHSSQKEA
ncbi:hypothetical protein [Lapidilactobacillus salsurivasis]